MSATRAQPDVSSLPGEGTLPGLAYRNAVVRPDAVALRQKDFGIWQVTTWSEYLDCVRGVALMLDEAGLRPGDRAIVVADNEPAWLFADLGIQASGALSVAAYPTQVASEIIYIMQHSQARTAFCGDQEQVDKLRDNRDELPELTSIVVFDMKGCAEYQDPMIVPFADFVARGKALHEQNPERFDQLLSAVSSDDIAYVGYTSGTTGKPKGALLRHSNQVTMAEELARWAGLTDRDRDFCHFPLCHPAVRVCDAYPALVTGHSVNFPESVETVTEDMAEIAPTFILGTPRVYEVMKADVEVRNNRAAWVKRKVYSWGQAALARVLDRRLQGRSRPFDRVQRFLAHWLVGHWVLDKLGLVKIRYACCGGSSVSPELLKFFWALGVPIFETYGQSETSGVAFSQRSYSDLGTAGWVLPCMEERITEEGELQIRGGGIFAGYLNDPAKTAEVFVDGDWYRTGDIARHDEQGRLVMIDREKHVITSGAGDELSPSELENQLRLSPYISNAMVIGEGRPFMSALLQIEYETVAEWAQDRGLAFTTFRSLTELAEVRSLLAGEVRKANVFLTQEKQVVEFRLLPRELDPDDDEITPTRKVKRQVVARRFSALVEEMYTGELAATSGAE